MELSSKESDLSITSSWISANAGSGKTYNLVSRVIKLLILGTSPEKILCITFTNSAADEMRIRLFDRLGEWVMMPEAELLLQIERLLNVKFTDQKKKRYFLVKARQLFAEVLESLSSLRISTIHSFCETVLRHFSLETGVPFDFKIIDEVEQREILEEILSDFSRKRNNNFLKLNALIKPHSENVLTDLALDIINNKNRITNDDFDQYFTNVDITFGKVSHLQDSSQKLRDNISSKLLYSLMDALFSGGKESQNYGKIIRGCLNGKENEFFRSLERVFLTKEKQLRDPRRFPEKKIKRKFPDLVKHFQIIGEHILLIREEAQIHDLLIKTKEIKKFGGILTHEYEKKKFDSNGLDYNDLLEKAYGLISKDGMLSWVKFKIDGKIGHVLVDESQDLSPIQWDIINEITGEFFHDQSIANSSKSIFIVGDDKQSIYSFQGASPQTFNKIKSFYSTKLKEVGSTLELYELNQSYRSSSVILNFVNEVFCDPTILGVKQFPNHQVKKKLPGRVEIWNNLEKQKKPEEFQFWWEGFFNEKKLENQESFAKKVAKEVSFIIDTRCVPKEHLDKLVYRRVEPRDILILFRSRSPLFYSLILELKRLDLPVMGADRFRLSDDIAVKDLISILKFLDNPLDDLSLAEALKSPIFNIDENTLFQLAYNRPHSLWENLLKIMPDHNATKTIQNLLKLVDYLTVYQLIELIFVEYQGVEKFANRLGEEVYEVLEEFLSHTLEYEKSCIASLSSFIDWFSRNDLEIKRQTIRESNYIKVMTVHMAKGQESPIVILPDSMRHSLNILGSKIIRTRNSFFYKQDKIERPKVISEIEKERKEEEKLEENRLLYVALTRSKYWLIICGEGRVPSDSWYHRCMLAYKKMSGNEAKKIKENFLDKMILEANWCEEYKKPLEKKSDNHHEYLVDTTYDLGKITNSKNKRLSPSNIGENLFEDQDETSTGEHIDCSKNYLEEGILIHNFLEKLGKFEIAEREVIALNIANINFPELTLGQVKLALEESNGVMQLKDSKRFFDGTAKFEIPVIGNVEGFGKISGKVDCLRVSGEKVEIIDFKTDRNPPKLEIEVKMSYILQIGLYTELIQKIYPSYLVCSYLLWTKNKCLMPISRELQKNYLRRFLKESGNTNIL